MLKNLAKTCEIIHLTSFRKFSQVFASFRKFSQVFASFLHVVLPAVQGVRPVHAGFDSIRVFWDKYPETNEPISHLRISVLPTRSESESSAVLRRAPESDWNVGFLVEPLQNGLQYYVSVTAVSQNVRGVTSERMTIVCAAGTSLSCCILKIPNTLTFYLYCIAPGPHNNRGGGK